MEIGLWDQMTEANRRSHGDASIASSPAQRAVFAPAPQVLTPALDLAKRVIQVYAVDATGRVIAALFMGRVSISNQFAKRGIDRFAGLAVERGHSEVPLLAGCSADSNAERRIAIAPFRQREAEVAFVPAREGAEPREPEQIGNIGGGLCCLRDSFR